MSIALETRFYHWCQWWLPYIQSWCLEAMDPGKRPYQSYIVGLFRMVTMRIVLDAQVELFVIIYQKIDGFIVGPVNKGVTYELVGCRFLIWWTVRNRCWNWDKIKEKKFYLNQLAGQVETWRRNGFDFFLPLLKWERAPIWNRKLLEV